MVCGRRRQLQPLTLRPLNERKSETTSFCLPFVNYELGTSSDVHSSLQARGTAAGKRERALSSFSAAPLLRSRQIFI
jgi:hypothetical protein